MRILIAIPTYDGKMEPETVKSLWSLDKCGNDVDLHVQYGYGVDMARNRIADRALDGRYDWLLTVDADMVLPKDALRNLLEHETDICMGYYRNRWASESSPKTCAIPYGGQWEQRLPVSFFVENRERGTHTVRVRGGGLGCCLIRPSVFERINFPWFEWHDWQRHAKSLGEDVDFFIKCERAGIPIYADTRVACGHKFRKVVDADK